MYILNLKVRDKILLPESYESPGFRFVGDNEDYVIHFDVDSNVCKVSHRKGRPGADSA